MTSSEEEKRGLYTNAAPEGYTSPPQYTHSDATPNQPVYSSSAIAPANDQAHQRQHNPTQHQYPSAVPLPSLSSSAAPVFCPKCKETTMTRTVIRSGNTTHAWAAGVCITTCLGCIPYLVEGTKDVEHRCTKCNQLLATWHRSGRVVQECYG